MRLQLLGLHDTEAPPCALLTTEREGILQPLYLFGAPEGENRERGRDR